ncbi:MAG: mitochondrial fission ELM1 family protein [Planctomycetota bacterium]
MPPKSLVQWRFLDGRPGHESQVLGLSEAFAAICPAVFVDVPLDAGHRGPRAFLTDQFRSLERQPRPHLLIGAGHATHAALLRCRQLFGGRSIVLMKPSLPPCLFDLCLVPRHDRLILPWPNVVRTAGAINRMRPSRQRPGGRGLALIGGPCRHFHWSDVVVRNGILRALSAAPLQWTVATSRRTPQSLLDDWNDRPSNVHWQTTGHLSGAEIASLIGAADRVLVTSDSMSMICEALTSGAAVELIDLPSRRKSRMSVEVRSLVQQGFWPTAEQCIPESDRCAALILQRLFPDTISPLTEASSGVCQGWRRHAFVAAMADAGRMISGAMLSAVTGVLTSVSLQEGDP